MQQLLENERYYENASGDYLYKNWQKAHYILKNNWR